MHSFSLLRSRTTAVVTGAVVVVGLGTTSGYAAAQITSAQIANNTIEAADVAADAIRSNEISDGTLRPADLGTTLSEQLAQPGTAGPAGDSAYDTWLAQGNTGSEQDFLASLKGDPGAKGDPGDPASDTLGGLSAQASSPSMTPLDKIGGSYTTNATTLFTLELPEAGTYLLNAYGYFDRLNEGAAGYEAPTTDTYLQLTVRGAGLGATCFTPAVPRRGFTETTCDASSVVTVDGPTTLTVRGFGYNEDRSGFGGTPNSVTPQFSAFAQLSAVKIG